MSRPRHGIFLFFLILRVCAPAVEVELDFDDMAGQDALPAAILKGIQEAHELNAAGIKALERGLTDAALALFEEALEVFPGYTDAENNVGVVHYRRGTLFEARRAWQAAGRVL